LRMANAALERQVREGLYVRVGSYFSKEQSSPHAAT
jgi:hypothetical protein